MNKIIVSAGDVFTRADGDKIKIIAINQMSDLVSYEYHEYRSGRVNPINMRKNEIESIMNREDQWRNENESIEQDYAIY